LIVDFVGWNEWLLDEMGGAVDSFSYRKEGAIRRSDGEKKGRETTSKMLFRSGLVNRRSGVG